jgi:hypothetical protein
LVLSGWSHRRTALAEYGVMVCCGVGALVFQSATWAVGLAIIGAWAAGFFVLGRAVVMVEQKASGRAFMSPS